MTVRSHQAMRKAGNSLKAISHETGVGLRIVPTTLDNAVRKGRVEVMLQQPHETQKRGNNLQKTVLGLASNDRQTLPACLITICLRSPGLLPQHFEKRPLSVEGAGIVT